MNNKAKLDKSTQPLFAIKETVIYPWGSKTRVAQAGDAVRQNRATTDDLATIDAWREAHRHVLNTFQAILRTRTRQTQVIVAQRHKRKQTIFGKLQRFPKMVLSRMDDVAGCRLIFEDLESLNSFRTKLHQANFKHRLRNDNDKWNYIKSPKSTGYRGIHDVYEYDVNSSHGKLYKGLLIELQYRTQPQHAWATSVEVLGFITESQPKFQQGDKRYETVMALASELIARAFENTTSCFPQLSNSDLIQQFLALDQELGLMKLLRGINKATNEVSDKKNVILMFSENESLEIRSFRDSTDALRALFTLEKDNPDRDIVLVRADTSDEVRIAFRNYFSDATEFINLIEKACERLGPSHVNAHELLGSLHESIAKMNL